MTERAERTAGVRAFVGLGSNVGDRAAHLDAAIAALEQPPRIRVLRESSRRTTVPVGGPPQDDYLNSVAEIETTLSPRELLAELHRIEATRGRTREVHWGPRTLDLDLLLYGDVVDPHPAPGDPVLPHPRMAERAFVLEPLAELGPTRRGYAGRRVEPR